MTSTSHLRLFAITMLTGDDLWFFWSLIGWGVGFVVHGIYVFGFMGIMGSNWEQRKIRELMEKDRNR